MANGACCVDGRLDCDGACDGLGVVARGTCCKDGKVDCNGICDGPGVADDSMCCADGEVDCNGVCNGVAVLVNGACCKDGKVDCNGVCDGPGLVNAGACCDDGKVDCNGVCDGAAVLVAGACCKDGKVDCNGICDGPGLVVAGACCDDGKVDCSGVCDGPGVTSGSRCCPSGTCPPPTCCDGIKDGTETGADCGGSCFAGCPSGEGCSTAADCAGTLGISSCVAGVCKAPSSPVMFAKHFTQIWGIATNPVDGTVYATVGTGDPTYPNSLIAFSPGSTNVAWALPVGGTPGGIAVSDDGSTIYVATPVSISTIDSATRTITNTFAVGSDTQFGEAHAFELAVMPGDPTTVAVICGYEGGGYFSLHVYQNGVLLYPGATFDEWLSSSPYANPSLSSLAWGDPQTIFAYGADELNVVAVSPSGLSIAQSFENVITDGNGDVVIHFGAGTLFATSGQALSPAGNVLGTFGGLDTLGTMALSADASRVYVFGLDLDTSLPSFEYTVACFDPRFYTQTGGFAFDTSFVNDQTVEAFEGVTHWGTSGLVLWTDAPGIESTLILLPDILGEVHGCAPTTTPAMQYGCIKGPDATSDGGSVLSYLLDTSGITTDPITGALYATVLSSDTRYPDDVVAFAPGSSAVAWSATVGSDPGPIAVSDSGKVAWVALERQTV